MGPFFFVYLKSMEKNVSFKSFKIVKASDGKIIFESTGEYESSLEDVMENMIKSIRFHFSEIEKMTQDKDIKEGIIIMPLIEFLQ